MGRRLLIGLMLAVVVGCRYPSSSAVTDTSELLQRESSATEQPSPTTPSLLPPPTAAELRELDQIRQRMPSELRSPLTASPAEFRSAVQAVAGVTSESTDSAAWEENDWEATLRTAAKYLDQLAADREDRKAYTAADEIRQLAQRLRMKARAGVRPTELNTETSPAVQDVSPPMKHPDDRSEPELGEDSPAE